MTSFSSSPGNAPDKTSSDIQNIDNQLEQYIKEAERHGGSLPTDMQNNLFQLREQILALSKNKKIPENVRAALQQAVATLKPQKGEALDVGDLQFAKSQLDEVLKQGGTDLT